MIKRIISYKKLFIKYFLIFILLFMATLFVKTNILYTIFCLFLSYILFLSIEENK